MTTATCNQCHNTFTYDGKQRTCPHCGPDTPESTERHEKQFWQDSTKSKGKRTIDGHEIWFPNAMEANYYRFLKWELERGGEITDFVYQGTTFDFNQFVKKPYRRNSTYRPDFGVKPVDGNVFFIETKGYMNKDSLTKIKRFQKHYPHVRLDIVTYKDYKKLEHQVGGIVPGWER